MDIQKEQWERIKVQGKLKYIIFHWIISVAIPISIILPMIRSILSGELNIVSLLVRIIYNFCLFGIASVVFGLLKWGKYCKTFNNNH